MRISAIIRMMVWAALALVSGVSVVRADLTPMNGAAVAPNIAEIRIEDDGISVTLEVFVKDIAEFEELLPDDWLPEGAPPRPARDERLAEFAQSGLSFRLPGGDVLPVDVRLIEPRLRVDRALPNAGQIDPITGRMVPKAPDDPRVVYAELFYAFQEERPHRLEIVPPLDEEGVATVTIGMLVFDRDVPVTDFRYLSQAAALSVDWTDPWYSKFDNPNLRRHHRYPVMSFIYAEPYEIRHEALMRVRDAADLTGVTLNGGDFDEAERQAIAERLPELVKARSPMTVDGENVQPDFARLSFLRVGPSGLILLEPGEAVRSDAAIVGLIYSAPTETFAKQATVEWTLFTDSIQQIPAQTIDAAGPFLTELTPEDPVLTWTNYFKKPPYPPVTAVAVEGASDQSGIQMVLFLAAGVLGVVFAVSLAAPARVSRRLGGVAAVLAIACAGAVPVMQARQDKAILGIDDEQLTALATTMLNNIYRAFAFKQEDHVYDRLALTLSGEVLEQVYLEQRETLRVERAGGAQARVDALDVARVERLPGAEAGTLRLAIDWGVSGTVGHWGHSHRRTNDYSAELVFRPEDGVWKIVSFDVLAQERRL